MYNIRNMDTIYGGSGMMGKLETSESSSGGSVKALS
jgi:hypothetical protein